MPWSSGPGPRTYPLRCQGARTRKPGPVRVRLAPGPGGPPPPESGPSSSPEIRPRRRGCRHRPRIPAGHRAPRMTQRLPPVPSLAFLSALTGNSASRDALFVQAEQASLTVIRALERPVGAAVVALVELVLGIVRGRVQRLMPIQPRHLIFDEAVVVTVRPARRQWHRSPEAEIHVHLTRLQRI